MRHINEILNESLLDDEEDLLNQADETIKDIVRKEIMEYLDLHDFRNNFEISDYYVDDKLDKGGAYILCPGNTISHEFAKANQLNRRPTYKDRTMKIYKGDCSVYGDVPDGWPELLKIGNCSSFTYYSNRTIQQNMIPDACISFSANHLHTLSGARINCRSCMISDIQKQPLKPVYINTFNTPKKLSQRLSVLDNRYVNKWSDLSNIISNCKILSISDTPLSKHIWSLYNNPYASETYFEEYKDNEFDKLCNNNFKDLVQVNMYSEIDDKLNFLEKNGNKWEYHCYK